MTQEEKAKAYDEALKRAEKALEVFGTDKCEGARQIFSLFPELAESEDEKIRKEIMDFIDTKTIDSDERRNRWFSYLEKYKPISFTSLEDTKVKMSLIQYISELNQDVVHLHPGIETCNEWIAWLEKQGKQKPIWHNEDEEPQRGSLILLIMQSGTPIVAKIIEPNHTFNHGERWAYIDDLLEKQEQKPIVIIPKFRVGDNIKTTNEEPLTITKIDDKGYWSEDLFICGFDDTAKWELVEQKPAWSEEDINKPNGGIVMEDFNDGNGFYKVNLAYLNEKQVEEIEELMKRWDLQSKGNEEDSIISDLLDYFDEDKCLKHEVNDIVKWLKTIKPQQKGWGENEIKMLDNLITYLDERKDLLEEIKRTYIDWLKSLKQRIQHL